MGMSVAPAIITVPPTTMDEQTPSVRNLNIMWPQYFHAQLIDQKELDIISTFDKKDKQIQQQLLDQNGHNIALGFLTVLKKLNKEDPLKYLLTIIDDILTMNQANAQYFVDAAQVDETLPFSSFLRLVDKDDDYMSQKASKIVTLLLLAGGRLKPSDSEWYLGWLCDRLRSSRPAHIDAAVQSLQTLLLIEHYRLKFFETIDGVARLVDILKFKQNTFQTQYQVIFCLWLLSFSNQVASTLNRFDVIPLLIDIMKAAVKEKVIRVSLACLRNMLEKAPSVNLGPMQDHKLLNLCKVLSSRQWADEDIVADINYLQHELQRNQQVLSTFEEYASEVRSGKLEWSAVHRSDAFWRANAHNLNEGDYEILRILARLLNTSSDPQVLAIACHDIGEYVRVFPRGKKMVQELGAKQRIMELMNDSDPNVRYEALLAVQKYMVSNWEYLGKSTAAAAAANGTGASIDKVEASA